MRPISSSCLPSVYWRSLSVSLAHFCFNLPLVMFQSPLTSSVFIIRFLVLFLFLNRRQCDGKSVLGVGLSDNRKSKPLAGIADVTHPLAIAPPNDFQRPKQFPLAAKQWNHNHNDEQEADSAAANPNGTGKNGRE